MHSLLRRVPWFGFGLLVGASCLCAAEPVAVYLEFDGAPSPDSVEAMKREVATLIASSGLTIEWRLLAQRTAQERSPRLVVVRFTGKCATGSYLKPAEDEDGSVRLGGTVVESGEVLPFSEVRCDAVRQFLPEWRLPGNRHEKDRVLGRALGRVLAHELYHVLLRTTHHGHKGIAKAVETPGELRADSFAFAPSDLAALKDAKSP
jgi:hypothetical protein